MRQLLAKINSIIGGSQEVTFGNIDFRKLEQVLEYDIHDRSYFIEALTHRSYLQTAESGTILSNERLEFLGDSVLNLVVAEHLFRLHGNAPEGDLTKIRSRFVNRKALSIYAQALNLEDFVLLSPGASQIDARGMETILADTVEAIIGAIYLDGGYRQAHLFIERHMMTAVARGHVKMEDQNFKSKLLEHSQAAGLGPPRYTTIKEEGPDHNRIFTIEVYIGREAFGVGKGNNKKDAEQAAAEKALQKLNIP